MDSEKQFTITLDDDSYGGASSSAVTYSVDTDFTFDTTSVIDTGTDWAYTNNYIDKDVEKRLEAIEKRMNILVPDPAKLEKFQALQKAYEHYKELERLCELDEEEPELPLWR